MSDRFMRVLTSVLSKGLLLGAIALTGSEVSVAQAPPCEDTEVGCVDGKLLHVPSPEWRDQVIYFLMIDRFNDGDPTNNDQGFGLYRPDEEAAYSGGDLQGVIDKVDYIKDLGATAVWTTPPFANQWWSDSQHYGGYHGYWPRDFSAVDEHYGNLDIYQELSHTLHSKDMFLIMDIVVNHVGNFFEINDDDAKEKIYRSAGNSIPSSAPTQFPFNLNDYENLEHRKASVYNWTPTLKTFEDPSQELTYQMGGLDDINTLNPVVRSTFKRVFAEWIKKVGVDAYRVDTVKYVEPSFWNEFLHDEDGVLASAEKTGRDDFWIFGEVKESSLPFSAISEQKMRRYLSRKDFKQFSSLINFPLQEELVRVIAEGAPTSQLTYRIETMLETFDDPTLAPNFVSNHDVPRFGSQASEQSYKNALALMFTLPGVPILYQGDEQNLIDSRQAMFKGGYLSPHDQFNRESSMFGYVKSLIEMRQYQPALRRGTIEVLHDNPVGSGAFVFERRYLDQALIVAVNTSDKRALIADKSIRVKLCDLQTVFSNLPLVERSGFADQHLTGLLVLEPHEFVVFARPSPDKACKELTSEAGLIKMDQNISGKKLSESTSLTGHFAGKGDLKLVFNGDLESSVNVPVKEQGDWHVELPVVDLGNHSKTIQLYAPQADIYGERISIETSRYQALWSFKIADPKGDDLGLDGKLSLPKSDGFKGQQDLLGVRAEGAGDVMELTLSMDEITDGWIPVNGFDHVAFTILFSFPAAKAFGRDYADLDLTLPNDKLWSHASVVFGWGNYLTEYPNRKLGRAPKVEVNKAEREITLTYRASDFGQSEWEGVELMVTTWDRAGEGALRPITTTGGEFDYAGDPDSSKVLDYAELILKKHH